MKMKSRSAYSPLIFASLLGACSSSDNPTQVALIHATEDFIEAAYIEHDTDKVLNLMGAGGEHNSGSKWVGELKSWIKGLEESHQLESFSITHVNEIQEETSFHLSDNVVRAEVTVLLSVKHKTDNKWSNIEQSSHEVSLTLDNGIWIVTDVNDT